MAGTYQGPHQGIRFSRFSLTTADFGIVLSPYSRHTSLIHREICNCTSNLWGPIHRAIRMMYYFPFPSPVLVCILPIRASTWRAAHKSGGGRVNAHPINISEPYTCRDRMVTIRNHTSVISEPGSVLSGGLLYFKRVWYPFKDHIIPQASCL